jgi:hypothetical protein
MSFRTRGLRRGFGRLSGCEGCWLLRSADNLVAKSDRPIAAKAQLSGQPVDPVRSSMLDTAVSGAKKDIVDAVRQAYCIVVTRGTDDSVNAFKVTVDPTKPLFTTIKEDPKSRITDVALAPDALLPGSGSGFDLWREGEDRAEDICWSRVFLSLRAVPRGLSARSNCQILVNCVVRQGPL